MNDEVIVSILTYNKLEYTKKCLESLFKSNQLPYHRIVVTDNGSSDDTKTWLRSLGNKIRFIDNHVNVGFAEAHNNVMREYPQHDVVLVNNDIEVLENWLEILYNEVYVGNYGAVTPAIKVANGLDVGAVLDSQAKGKSIINGEQEPDWITGSCFYIRRDTIEKVGYLDNGFKFYYEDVDYCLRMKKAGIRFKCIREVVIVHHNSVSSNPEQKKKMMEESRLYFIKKHDWK